MTRVILVVLVCALAFVMGPTSAHALLCNPILGCSCSVSATAMNFGTNLSPLSGSPATAQADITVSCSNVIDALPSVSAQIGPGLWGTTGARAMRSTTSVDTLSYNLYSSGAYTTILGSGGATAYPALTFSGGVLSLGGWTATRTIYGRAILPATTRPQTFTDTVVVRIDW